MVEAQWEAGCIAGYPCVPGRSHHHLDTGPVLVMAPVDGLYLRTFDRPANPGSHRPRCGLDHRSDHPRTFQINLKRKEKK